MSKFVSHRSPLARATGAAVLMLAGVAPLGCGSDEAATAPATEAATAPAPSLPEFGVVRPGLGQETFR